MQVRMIDVSSQIACFSCAYIIISTDIIEIQMYLRTKHKQLVLSTNKIFVSTSVPFDRLNVCYLL